MNESLKPAFLEGAMVVGLCAAIGGMIGIVAYQGIPLEAVQFTMLLLPFLPVPVALLTARHGVATGTVAGLVIGSICTTWTIMTGSSVGLLVFLFTAVAGVFAGIGFRTGVSLYRMLVMTMLLFLGMILTWFGAFLFKSGIGPVDVIWDFAGTLAEQSSGFYEATGFIQGNAAEVASEVRDSAFNLMPAMLVVAAGLMSIIMVAFSRFVFGTVKQAFPPDIRFSELRLHFGFVYLFIVSLAFLLAGYTLSGMAQVWVEAIGDNLMLVTRALFFIQGLAIAAWFLQYRKSSGAVKVAVYFALGLLEMIFLLVSFVGIFDIFMDFRKRYSSKKDGQPGINKK